jgi:hypothetical protein
MVGVADATVELIDRYAPDIEIPPPVVLEQARRNLALRVRMLEEFGAIDPRELAVLVGSAARNPASTVGRGGRWCRVFSCWDPASLTRRCGPSFGSCGPTA